MVDAVRCAVLIQRAWPSGRRRSPEAERIRFRIGINLGDVIHEADGHYGDGVNVAARLEQLSEPGGVLISGTAYDHLQGKLDLPLEFSGEQRVKNIERPVRAYRVRLDGTAFRLRSCCRRARPLALPGTRRQRWRRSCSSPPTSGTSGRASRRPGSEAASIAVLPFDEPRAATRRPDGSPTGSPRT